MTIFDDPKFGLSEVDGIEVDPQDIEFDGASEGEPRRISWRVVDLWCRTYPGRVRLIPAIYQQATTRVRRHYPHLTVRSTKQRLRPGEPEGSKRSVICDLLVTYVPPGEPSPFDEEIPGIPLRVTSRTAVLDGRD